jgi:hypothetical protein
MVNSTVSESLIISFWKLGVAGLDLDLLGHFSAGIDLILMAFQCAEEKLTGKSMLRLGFEPKSKE